MLGDEAVRLQRATTTRRRAGGRARRARAAVRGRRRALGCTSSTSTARAAGRVRPELVRARGRGGRARAASRPRAASARSPTRRRCSPPAPTASSSAPRRSRTPLARWSTALGDRLVVALDVRDGRVSRRLDRGLGPPVERAVARCVAAGVARVLCTAIDRDGTLAGPDLELLVRVCAAGLPVLAAGGIRSEDDLAALEGRREGAIVGRALLEGGVPLSVLRAG